MRLFKTGRLKRILRQMTLPFRCRVVILMYHRVTERSSDPWNLCVSPRHFAEHLKILKQNYPILSLHDLLISLKNARLPKRGVVLTFDDGYADNLWNAKPLLEKYEVPGTVFVASGSIDNKGFWWDDLERALLQPKKLPKSLQLSVQGRSYEWPTKYSEQRQQVYMAIHKILQPLSTSDRDKVMTELFTWADIDQTDHPDYQPLATAELIQLAQSEFIDIGAHTVTHPLLSVMSQAEQSAEIVGSRQKLTEILGSKVDTFSYPYGNFTTDTVDIVKAAGFEMALACETNVVEKGANQFQLGRFGVGDWEGEKFRQHLHEFFRTL
jgi:peptidoglycan/xylan/chitin deacetylase (PgdA/CDA1 family)